MWGFARVLWVRHLASVVLVVLWGMSLFLHMCCMCQHICIQNLSFLASSSFLRVVPVSSIIQGVQQLVYCGVTWPILGVYCCCMEYKSCLCKVAVCCLHSKSFCSHGGPRFLIVVNALVTSLSCFGHCLILVIILVSFAMVACPVLSDAMQKYCGVHTVMLLLSAFLSGLWSILRDVLSGVPFVFPGLCIMTKLNLDKNRHYLACCYVRFCNVVRYKKFLWSEWISNFVGNPSKYCHQSCRAQMMASISLS